MNEEKTGKKNTLLSYQYRDADNYKKLNTVVLEGTLSKKQIAEMISLCEDDEYFIPEQVGLPAERFSEITEADHCWFELDEDGFSETDAVPTISMTAQELYQSFVNTYGIWDDIRFAI